MEFPGHPLTPHYWNCSMKTFILKIFCEYKSPASSAGGNADGRTSGVFYDRSRTEHKPITVYKITQ